MGEKGQLILPREARELFGLEPDGETLAPGDEERGRIALLGG